MRYTFLSKGTFTAVITIALLFLLVGSVLFSFLILLLLFGVAFILRKKIVYDHDDQFTTRGMFYAPISGRVVARNENDDFLIVTIVTNFYDNLGIYLPLTCEVKNLYYNKEAERYFFPTSSPDLNKGVTIELRDKNKQEINLNFLKNIVGYLPELVVLPGDRGQRQANIGYYLFGGITNIFLPKTFKVDVSVGDKVISTETIIAHFDDKETK